MKKFLLLVGLSVMTSLFGLAGADIAILQKNANRGDAKVQFNLGLCYDRDKGVVKI